MVVAAAGRARRSTRRCSRSPSGSSASSRRRTTSTGFAATPRRDRPTIFVDLKQSTPPSKMPDIWSQVRNNIGDIRHTLPAGIVGPGFNDDFGDTYGIIYGFTADGFTLRELATTSRPCARACCWCRTFPRSRFSARKTNSLPRVLYRAPRGTSASAPGLCSRRCRRRTSIRPAGVMQTGDERVFLRVSGAFDIRAGHRGSQLRRRAIAFFRCGTSPT